MPGTEPAAAAAEAAVVAWRELRDPPGAGATTAGFDAPPADPLDAAARLVAEDLCLLVPGSSVGAPAGGRRRLGARCRLGVLPVALAAAPTSSAGPVAAIHDPVPHYADELGRRVDRFLARLGPGAVGVAAELDGPRQPDRCSCPAAPRRPTRP